MMNVINAEDIDLILMSLIYTEKAFQEYTHYPSGEYKQQQIEKVRILHSKLTAYKKELKNDNAEN